jgi:hypothetical protein
MPMRRCVWIDHHSADGVANLFASGRGTMMMTLHRVFVPHLF